MESQWWWKENKSILFQIGKKSINNSNGDLYLNFGVDISIDKSFTL